MVISNLLYLSQEACLMIQFIITTFCNDLEEVVQKCSEKYFTYCTWKNLQWSPFLKLQSIWYFLKNELSFIFLYVLQTFLEQSFYRMRRMAADYKISADKAAEIMTRCWYLIKEVLLSFSWKILLWSAKVKFSSFSVNNNSNVWKLFNNISKKDRRM